MTDVRFDTIEDTENDCLTVIDNEDKLKTSFDSEIIISPCEDASILVRELNIQCAVNEMLIEELEKYECMEDIIYWIKEIKEEF